MARTSGFVGEAPQHNFHISPVLRNLSKLFSFFFVCSIPIVNEDIVLGEIVPVREVHPLKNEKFLKSNTILIGEASLNY